MSLQLFNTFYFAAIASLILFLFIASKNSKLDNLIRKINDSKIVMIIIGMILPLVVVSFNFIPGYIKGHDLSFHLSRINGIADGLRLGQFPVYIYPGYLNGCGYANGLFYPDIFLYPSAILTLLKVPTIIAYKLQIVSIVVFSYITMYFSVYNISNSKEKAIVSASIYVTSSYFFTDIYVRAALGESLAFIFYPLLILGLYKIIFDNPNEGYYYSLGIAGICLSHVISTLFCIFISIFFVLINIKKVINEKRIKHLLIFGFLSIGLSSFFLIPFIKMMLADTYYYSLNFESGLVSKNAINPLYSFIEIDHYTDIFLPQGIGIVFIFVLIYQFKQIKESNSTTKQLLICGLLSLFLSTKIVPWNLLESSLGIIQFPWRLFSIATLCLTIVIGLVSNNEYTKIVLLLLISLSLATSFYNLSNNNEIGITEIEDRYNVGRGEYIPIGFNQDYANNLEGDFYCNHDIDIKFKEKGNNITISYSNNIYDDTYIEIPKTYYSIYKVKYNKTDMNKSQNGLIKIDIEEAEGIIVLQYSLPTSVIIGTVLTLLCVAYINVIEKTKN